MSFEAGEEAAWCGEIFEIRMVANLIPNIGRFALSARLVESKPFGES